MKGRFVWITDTHYALTSNVRTGDYLNDLLEKTEFVVNLANSKDAIILHSGDFFDKPTVPDEVKTRLVKVFQNCKYKPICIDGNHDRLYGSVQYYERTSFYNMYVNGVIDILTQPLEFDDCVLLSSRPLIDHASKKPQVNLWHGFLNIDDGEYTFNLTDIYSETNNLVLLGHDHGTYEPIYYKNTTILREGSFVRAIRTDISDRIPNAIFIEVVNGKFEVTVYPIEVAKPVELLFKHRPATQVKTTVSSYSEILNLLNNSKEGVTLFDALTQVAEPYVVDHIKYILTQQI